MYTMGGRSLVMAVLLSRMVGYPEFDIAFSADPASCTSQMLFDRFESDARTIAAAHGQNSKHVRGDIHPVSLSNIKVVLRLHKR